MTNLANVHADAANLFAKAKTPDECIDALAALTGPMGYTRFHYSQAFVSRTGKTEARARTPRMGREYEDSWAADAHRMADPLVHHCLHYARPKFWSELKGDYNHPDMTDAHRLKIASIADYGLSAGFTIRLRCTPTGSGRFFSGISLVQDVECNASEHDRAFSERSPQLEIILEHFTASLQISQAAQAHFNISDREYDVLHLLADGLQVQQIADRMCLSDRTTAHHLSSLRRKMGANSNAHAVALAMKIHMI